MKLKWIDADTLDRNVKATVHKSGKLGFTREAASKLRLTEDKSVVIGINEDDAADKNLYAVFYSAERDGAFKVNKAGEYFYLNVKPLFDELKVNYKKDSVVYDISKTDELDSGLNEIYRFKRRELPQKKAAPTNVEASN